jgi:hypothetical protein
MSIRNNKEKWSKAISFRKAKEHLSDINEELIDYLLSSNLSCMNGENKEICDEIFQYYNLSKALTLSGKNYGFCSQIYYLPELYSITSNKLIKNDIEYILQNYPFGSECSYSNGALGLCAFDLAEKSKCVTFLSGSLTYFSDDETTKIILADLLHDTLISERNLNKPGVWGKNDINILMEGTQGDELYPVQYFNTDINISLYNIIKQNYNEK